MGFLGGLLSSVAGGVLNLFGQQSANQSNQQFTEQMSNSAYTRASADMKNAGLNPAMMFGSGSAASSPMGQQQNTMAGLGDAVQKSASSATQTQVAMKTIDNLTQQLANLKTDQANTAADTLVKNSMVPQNNARTANIKADTDNQITRNTGMNFDNDTAKSRAQIARDLALSATNRLDINSTARSIADKSSFFGRTASDVVDPIASSLNAVHSAGKAKAIWDMLNLN